jgi:hypothetical protein
MAFKDTSSLFWARSIGFTAVFYSGYIAYEIWQLVHQTRTSALAGAASSAELVAVLILCLASGLMLGWLGPKLVHRLSSSATPRERQLSDWRKPSSPGSAG